MESLSSIPSSVSALGLRFEEALHQAALELASWPGPPAPAPEVVAVGEDSGFLAFLLAALHRRIDWPLLVVVSDGRAAQQLAAALETFDPAPPGELSRAALAHPGDVTPFHEIAPSRTFVMERLAALLRLRLGLGLRYLVVPADSLLRQMPSPELIARLSIRVRSGDQCDRSTLLVQLASSGYAPVPAACDPGTFAVRGSVVDVFSPLYPRPIRLDFWDNELESIKFFDADTQRSEETADEVWLSPAREIPLDAAGRTLAERRLLELAGELGFPSSQMRPVIEDLRSGGVPHGAEGWLPAFAEQTSLLVDHLPAQAVVVLADSHRIAQRLDERYTAMEEQHGKARARGRLVFPVSALAVPAADALQALESRARLRLEALAVGGRGQALDLHPEGHAGLREALRERHGVDEALAPLVARVQELRQDGDIVLIACHTQGGGERMAGMLRSYGLKVSVQPAFPGLDAIEGRGRGAALRGGADVIVAVGEVGRGFRLRALHLTIIDESEILGPKTRRREQRRPSAILPEAVIASFQDLQVGDHVVHADYGVARYDGLFHLVVQDLAGDFLRLLFAGDEKLYLPVYNLHKVQRHTSAEAEAPSRDKLGGTSWEKVKARVKAQLLEMAKQLVNVQAARQSLRGFAFSAPGEYYREFEASFPYEETPDQQRAIDEVLADLERDQPMDRLVCGDVGFGKTEVAIRAAFRAVEEGRQVAVLVPTTVLAEQHLATFRKRMEDYPVQVESLSRTKSGAELRRALDRLATGRIDVVIGTHRLLSKDVAFRNLGLVVIDEEHRFGVRHKEQLKTLRTQAHVLTLTATPIPRTMHLAMMGIRDLSVMRTPPEGRLAVRTIVERMSEDVVTEALERELARGGQAFYIHNRVSSIWRRAEALAALLPHARIAVAHGQMNEGEMTGAMRRFIEGEANILVSTTIVESGIDIPAANTLVVERADTFGLAELYQLRGRVGRSSSRAYAYFLIPDPSHLSTVASRRIGVLQRFSELGSGFHVASQDLEIRGAGNILGAEQSGQIEAIGFDLYYEMLEAAIADLKGLPPARRLDPEMRLPVEAFIPESWCPDVGLRLLFYKRMAQAGSASEVGDVLADLVDRCGSPPPEVRRLAELAELKLLAAALSIDRVDASAHNIAVRFSKDAQVDPMRLLAWLREPGVSWRPSRDADALARALPSVSGEESDLLRRAKMALLELSVVNWRGGGPS